MFKTLELQHPLCEACVRSPIFRRVWRPTGAANRQQ